MNSNVDYLIAPAQKKMIRQTLLSPQSMKPLSSRTLNVILPEGHEYVFPKEIPKEHSSEKGYRTWHFWTAASRAGPTYVHAVSPFAKQNSILRTEPATPPPMLKINRKFIVKEPEMLVPSMRVAKELTQFWNECYRADDWIFEIDEARVADILNRSNSIALAIRTPEGLLVGTALSSHLPGVVISGTREIKEKVYQVEGLVLHPQLRERGAAGWLLGWLDYYTSQKEPVVHVWFRDSHKKQAALPNRFAMSATRQSYAETSYIRLSRPMVDCIQMPWSAVSEVLHEIYTDSYNDFDVLYIPNRENPDVQWWLADMAEHPACAVLVGIANTHKLRRIPHFLDSKGIQKYKYIPIHNIVFTCIVRRRPGKIEDLSSPFWWEQEKAAPGYIRESIEAAVYAMKCEIVTIYDTHVRGDFVLENWKDDGWTICKESKWKFYMYNWMPSNFGHCEVIWPHIGI